jgi:adenylate cyclase
MNVDRLRFLLSFLALLAAGLAALHWRAFEPMDRTLLDAEFRLLREHAPQPVTRDVVLVGVDENTFRALREPFALWHPHLGLFLKGMAAARPAVVGLDIVLPDKSYNFLIPNYDQPLLEGLAAMRGAVPVVLAQSLDEHGNQRQLFPPYLSLVGKDALGSVAVCRDPDLVIRRFDETRCSEIDAQATLAGRMAKSLGIEHSWSGYIDYAAGDAVSYLPFHEVLEWIRNGEERRLESAFRDKPVLLGVILPYSDRHPLPVPLAAFEPDTLMLPGALIHVQALRSMLHRGFVQPLPEAVLLLLGAIALALWFGRTGLMKVLLALATVAVALAGSLLLLWKGSYTPGATLALLALAAFAARLGYDALEQARERRFLRHAFGSYVSPQILKEILRGRINPGVAGRRARICVMFCDIRGFTARAEQLAPEEVITLLNEYFSALTAAIYKHGGTTNKFLGDGLLAFFGAPQPLANSEKSALEAAQDMLTSLEPLNRQLASAGKAPVAIGIGLHSGEVVLGHVGGRSHQEYTAIGDVVNIASRLEALTKELPYPVVCSSGVADAVGRAGNLQDLGVRPLRGHHAHLHVFGWQPPVIAAAAALTTHPA